VSANAEPPAAVGRTELQRASASVAGQLIVQTLFRIPVGLASGRHSHPGEEVGYIIHGDVEMVFDDDRPSLTLRSGDPFLIPPSTIHNARNIGTVTTKMLSTYFIDETQPLVTMYS
jgi:quercetin dioxygenase-like cupin family protein